MLALDPLSLDLFTAIANRERCPFAVVGTATAEQRLVLRSSEGNAIDVAMDVLFGKPPKMQRDVDSLQTPVPQEIPDIQLEEVVTRLLSLPTIASKMFLITIADRTVTGMVARDQCVGRYQVPVADCGVVCTSQSSRTGSSIAVGERPLIGLLNAAASARMAVAESLLNLLSSDVSRVALSCNWMADASTDSAALYAAVEAVSNVCVGLGVSVPVGKDSMSMKAQHGDSVVVAPVSLVVTAYGHVSDVTRTLTPEIGSVPDTSLVFIDLSGLHRTGGSCYAQVC